MGVVVDEGGSTVSVVERRRPGPAIARGAPWAARKGRQIARRAAAPVSMRPGREAARTAVRMSAPLSGAYLTDGAGNVLGEGLRIGPAASQAPGAEPGAPRSTERPMAPFPSAKKAVVDVSATASTPGR